MRLYHRHPVLVLDAALVQYQRKVQRSRLIIRGYLIPEWERDIGRTSRHQDDVIGVGSYFLQIPARIASMKSDLPPHCTGTGAFRNLLNHFSARGRQPRAQHDRYGRRAPQLTHDALHGSSSYHTRASSSGSLFSTSGGYRNSGSSGWTVHDSSDIAYQRGYRARSGVRQTDRNARSYLVEERAPRWRMSNTRH